MFAILLVHPLALALPAVLLLLLFGTWGMVRAARRSLAVTDDGLRLQRDRYRLEAPWHAVEGVDHGRRRGLIKADEIILTGSRVSALDHRDRPTSLPNGLEGHPATKRVQVSLYDRDWASGPVGAHLRANGIKL